MKLVVSVKRSDGIVRSILCRQNNFELDIVDTLKKYNKINEIDKLLEEIENEKYGDDLYSLGVIEEFEDVMEMIDTVSASFVDNIFYFNNGKWWYSEFDDDISKLKKL